LGSGKKAGKRSAKGDAKRDAKARPADVGLGWDELEARDRAAQARLAALQQQLGDVLAALSESSDRLQAAVSMIDDLPTSETANEAGLELRRRLEQMLVAQQRTNELLDLALGVALEPGELPPRLTWRPARS